MSIYISNDLFFIERARSPPIFHAKSYYSNFSCPLEHKRKRISRSHRLLRRESERNPRFFPIFASSAGSIHGSASVITATDKNRGYESRYPPPSSTTKRTCPHPKACISNRGNLIARGTRRGRARGKKEEHDG